MNYQYLKQPSSINDKSIISSSKYNSPRMEQTDLIFDNNSDRINGNKKTIAAIRYKRLKKQQQSRIISDDEIIQKEKEKRVFKTSLQKLYEESFVKNIVDNSYIKKIGQLSTYQVQVLDDLQFGTDKQADDIDNVFYSFFSRYLDKISVIYPQSNFKIFWNALNITTFILTFLWLPYRLAFETNYMLQLFNGEQNDFLEIGLFSICGFDILISLNEAYIHKGIIINQRYHIIMHYLKTVALADLVSIFSLLYLLILVHYQDTQNMSIEIILCLLYGILKIGKIKQIFNQFSEYFNIKGLMQDCLAISQIIVGNIYFIHLTACVWHGLGQPTDRITWLDKNNLRSASNITRYAECMNLAAAYLTGVGASNIVFANSDELLFATAVSFISLIIIGIMVVSLGFFFYKQQRSSIYQKSMKVMNNFMSMNKINFDLQVRIRNYLDYICRAEQSMLDEDVTNIVNKLSERLQSELKYQLRASILEQCEFITKNFSQKLRQSLVTFMEEVNTIPEERIVEMNEFDDSSIFIINKGEMDVVYEARNKMNVKSKRNNIKTLQVRYQFYLEKGEYFGFYGFVTGLPRTASVVSKGFCKLFKIKREDFVNLLDQFPDDREIFFMIKDTVIINQDLSDLQIKCYGCKSNTHIVNTCPFLHFNPNQDRVIKQALYPHLQDRDDPYQPRKSKFINALLQQQIIEQIVKELQIQLMQDETQDGTQATHVLLQDDMSETDSRTYSQMRTRSISRVQTHSAISMQQQSSNRIIQQQHVQQAHPLPQVDEVEVEMQDDQESNIQASFDDQMNNRKEFNRKNDPKHTVETAGFGNKFRKSFREEHNDNEDLEDSEEQSQSECQEQDLESSDQNQQMKKSASHQSYSPQNSGSQNRNPQQMNQKVTFQQQQQHQQQNSNTNNSSQNQSQNYKPRTSIKRGTTKTNNTAIIFDNVLAQLQENQNFVIEFVNLYNIQPIITQPSMGEFDKIMTFRKYYPQHNINAVLKVLQRYQRQSEHQPQFSLYSFIFTAIQRGRQLRNAVENIKISSKATIFYNKAVNNKPQKYFKRQQTQKQAF